MKFLYMLMLIVGYVGFTRGVGTFYGMSYNYFDEMAQSMCTSVTDRASYVFAVRRNCSGGRGKAPTCNAICRSAKPQMSQMIRHLRTRADCFDAYNIKKTHKTLRPNPGNLQPDAGKPFMFVYRYFQGGCTWKPDHCGPNYCCCRMY